MSEHPPPGEYLKSYIEQQGITQMEFAKRAGIGRGRVTEIIQGKRTVTADMAIRFEIAGAYTAVFWLLAQAHRDIDFLRETRYGLQPEPAADDGQA